MPSRLALSSFGMAVAMLAGCARDETPLGENRTTDFVVVAASPTGTEVRLNDAMRITFNQPVDLDSVTPTTLALRELDANGLPGRSVAGTLQLADEGRTLHFDPALPTDGSFAHGGLRPGSTYQVDLAGGTTANAPVVRTTTGNGLAQPFAFAFTTASGTLGSELYRDAKPGGPARAGLDVNTTTNLDDVPLAAFGQDAIEVRLSFDQPLDPSAANVPANVDTDPRTRDPSQRGRISLEYADVSDAPGTFTWIPAEVELERNANDGAVVVLRPLGVLPNHATIRVIAEATLTDLTGESNVGAAGHDRVFGTLRTAAAWSQQWHAVLARFSPSTLDPAAAFPEPPAEVGPGYVRAGFAFDGDDTTFDYTPLAVETILNTNHATLQPVQGLARTVAGGVFRLRDFAIPAGSTVLGQGSNPMVFLCSGTVTLAGTLSVRGGNGARSSMLGQYHGPGDVVAGGSTSPWPAHHANGGRGQCGGGDGGDSSPNMAARDARGGNGYGAGQAPALGGRGGYLACVAGCYTGSGYNGSGGGSGGGGGALATQGDPHFRGNTPATIVPNTPPTANTTFQQVRGYGGSGCSGGAGARTAMLAGGEPADLVFTDSRADNDFWGTAYDAHRHLRILGELTLPVGGSGGGGGGDTSRQMDCSAFGSNPALDERGGGGGAGGGIVIIKALGEIRITASGRIVADGGHGGGGEQIGACGEAGGGGGGSGGMVVLMSATAIRIEAHGTASTNRFVYGDGSNGPFAGNDYSFAISADGGVCTTGGFGAVNVATKYPASGQAPMPGTTYDQDPLGGFGGMGIVQLMAPAGTNGDGTNTILDDNIHFYLPGQLAMSPLPQPITAAGKRQLLAWRGQRDASGQAFDDFGNVVDLGKNDGDIRPAPMLLPSTFGPRSRARSRWIDTGRSDRRALAAPDDFARGLVMGGGVIPGPRYEFAGTDATTGFAAWWPVAGGNAPIATPVVVPDTPLASISDGATFRGSPAYRLQLATPALPPGDRYAQYTAELLGVAGDVLAHGRVLAHDERELLVDPAGQLLPTTAVRLRLVARFFEVVTNEAAGLPVHTPPSSIAAQPRANVRLGFAFHTDPRAANPLQGRYPSTSVDAFVHDLADPALQAWLAANQPRFVMWDATFDLAFDTGFGAAPLTPNPPRPELRELRLPFRF